MGIHISLLQELHNVTYCVLKLRTILSMEYT